MFTSQPHLTSALAAERSQDLRRAADRFRLTRTPPGAQAHPRRWRLARAPRATATGPVTRPASGCTVAPARAS